MKTMNKAAIFVLASAGLLASAATANASFCMFGSMNRTTVAAPPKVMPPSIMGGFNPASAFSSSAGSSGISGGTVQIDFFRPVEPSATVTPGVAMPMGPYTVEQQRRVFEARQEYNTAISAAANSTAKTWDYATKTAEVADTVGAVTQQGLAFIPGAGSAANGVLDVARGGAEGAAGAYAEGKSWKDVLVSGAIGATSNAIANKITAGMGGKAEALTAKGERILAQVAEGATRSTIDKSIKGGVNVVAGAGTTGAVEMIENVVGNTAQSKLESTFQRGKK